jgi:hypothetical protein
MDATLALPEECGLLLTDTPRMQLISIANTKSKIADLPGIVVIPGYYAI